MPTSKTIRFDYTLLERLVDMEKATERIAVTVGAREKKEIAKMARHFGISKAKYLRLLHICAINAYMTGQFEGFVETKKDLHAMKLFKKSLYNKEWRENKNDKKSKEKIEEENS